MLEYFCFPVCSRSRSSERSTPSVSAAEYRYRPWPASSWTLAIRMALRRRLGALPDERLAVCVRHPVPRLDALVGGDELVEAPLGVPPGSFRARAALGACGAGVVVAVHGASSLSLAGYSLPNVRSINRVLEQAGGSDRQLFARRVRTRRARGTATVPGPRTI